MTDHDVIAQSSKGVRLRAEGHNPSDRTRVGYVGAIVPLHSNPGVWFSPFIAAAIFYMWWSVLAPFPADPTWTNYVARAGDGLQYGLPFAAAASAWCGWRLTRNAQLTKTALRSSIRIIWAHLWPIFAGVALGLLLVVLAECLGTSPWPGVPNLGLIVVFAAMAVTAVGFGWVLGKLLPLALALPASLFLIFEWAIYPLADGSNVSYRNMTGYAVFSCCEVASYEPDWRAILAPVVIALALVLIVVWSLRSRTVGWSLRSVPVLGAALVVANLVTIGTAADGATLRTANSLACSGQSPQVCLYPEISASDSGPKIRSVLSNAFVRARDAGVSLPGTITNPARGGSKDAVTAIFSGPFEASRIVQTYANGVYETMQCSKVPPTRTGMPQQLVIPYALSLSMGLAPADAVPAVSISAGGEGSGQDRPLTPTQIIQRIGFSSKEEAVRVANTWIQQQALCSAGGR